MGQNLQINKRGQWNKRGQCIFLSKNINVDMGKIYIRKVDKGDMYTANISNAEYAAIRCVHLSTAVWFLF